MLYDILCIDDDFKNTDGVISLDGNAHKLLLEFIRDNLRVTYTTGELEDVENLERKDLSCIQYVFCDLHLSGINFTNNYKQINSKLAGIFEQLNTNIKSDKITIFINSKFYQNTTYDKKGKDDLQERLDNINSEKFILEVIDKKNELSEYQKDALLENHLNIHIKSLIINKALEIESIFDKKLGIDGKFDDVITFENKYKKLNAEFKVESKIKKQIQLLQQMRNKVAHSDNNFDSITDDGMKKTFWNIVEKKEGCTDTIKFESFEGLIKYIDSIDKIKQAIQSIQSKLQHEH